jgi:hypothetical protein
MIRQIRSGWLIGLGIVALAGCTTMRGSGYGSLGKSEQPVTFNWTSKDAVSGTMTAQLPGNETFSGPFFQITQQTRGDTLTPLWFGWRRGWNDWPYYGAYGPTFQTLYSGKVVANLNDAEGRHMRCRFHLIRPSSGMEGGGAGECQIAGGDTIEANFPAA